MDPLGAHCQTVVHNQREVGKVEIPQIDNCHIRHQGRVRGHDREEAGGGRSCDQVDQKAASVHSVNREKAHQRSSVLAPEVEVLE